MPVPCADLGPGPGTFLKGLKRVILYHVILLLFYSCHKQRRTPLLTTNAAFQWVQSITARGVLYAEGDAPLLNRGFCWANHAAPTVADHTAAVPGTGKDFSTSITPVSYSTLYYVRAFATNEFGTSYGKEIAVFTATPAVVRSYLVSSDLTALGVSAEVIVNGGGLLECGVCWSSGEDAPTIDGPHAAANFTAFSFNALAQGLQNNTSYTLRAYVTTTAGVGYSNAVKARTCYGTMTDPSGRSYKTVLIGGKEWLAENYRSTVYADSAKIQYFPSDAQWTSTDRYSGAYCYFSNDVTYLNMFGLLYNSYVITNNLHSIAPKGWHVPTKTDFDNLIAEVGNHPSGIATLQLFGNKPSGSNNYTGFSAMNGGTRLYYGPYSQWGDAMFWTKTYATPGYLNYLQIYFNNTALINEIETGSGLYLRLVRD